MPKALTRHRTSLDRMAFGPAALRCVLAAAGCFGLSACSLFSTEPSATLGVAPSHTGYVPARIAILNCQAWPNGAQFTDLPLTNADNGEVAKLCGAIDTATVAAFSGQPYMRGYSPKVVERELEKSGKKNYQAQLAALFAHGADSCLSCRDVPNFYLRTLAPRQAWRAWLLTLGKTAKNSDAALFPFLTYAYSKRYSDRGLTVAERAAGVALLLIDTESGDLIWAGAREAVAPNRRLETARPTDPKKELAPPPWEEAMARLLTEDLWRDFPGRQIY